MTSSTVLDSTRFEPWVKHEFLRVIILFKIHLFERTSPSVTCVAKVLHASTRFYSCFCGFTSDIGG